MSKIYLIDGMSVVFRAYHAMSQADLSAPDGTPTGALFGFTNIISSILDKEQPEYFSVVFDMDGKTFRHDQYEDYKANREEMPDDLCEQIPKIKEMLDLMNIPRVEKSGFEADDIIGTIAKEAGDDGWEVICVTNDKDFFQLVNDKVTLYRPRPKGEVDIIDHDKVIEKFGVAPDKVIDVMALIGDKVDNVPGVKGIGEKTAAPLIQEYGSLEALYENLDKIDKKSIRTKLENDRENAFMSKDLVTIKTDVELEVKFDAMKRGTPKYKELDEFFKGVGFNTLRKQWHDRGVEQRIIEEKTELEEIAESNYDTILDSDKSYTFVDSQEKLDSMLEQLEGAKLLSIDLETSSLDRAHCQIVGIALAAREGKAYYIGTYDDEEASISEDTKPSMFDKDDVIYDNAFDIEFVLTKLKPILTNKSIGKIGQNLKFDAYILSRKGIELDLIVFDTMLASYILNPDDKHNLDAISKKWLQYEPVNISLLIGEKRKGQKSMKDINPKEISDYACEDADLALKLRNKLYEELKKEEKLLELGEQVEFPLVSVLTKMELNGIAIDTNALAEISEKIETEVAELTDNIYEEAGTDFNIDSPKQLSHILFEKLGIPPQKKTKTGFSTDVQVLQQLSPAYPIADYILTYRGLVKLKSTYVDALPKLINERTGRLHTTYNQTVASTGRLSSSDPNLQNIPIRTDLGKEIRRAFIPGNDDSVILAADYSQVELRIMAYISGDEALIRSFKDGLDIHSATAANLFDKSIDEVSSDDRRIAKTVNFGIMYGLGAFGLSQRLGLERKRSKEIIDNYFIKFPGIREYIDSTIKDTEIKGFAETLLGRRRYFSDINARNRNLKQAAERGAINMPIQGTAADMMKIAMINIYKEMKKREMKSMMMLQVHDELVFEARKSEVEQLRELTIDKMKNALPLGEVPIEIDTGVGENWFEAH